MIAYKFLSQGAIGPISTAQWPPPREWLEVEGALEVCANGIHACTSEALAYWLGEELWAVELDGEILDEGTVLVASRGRLVSRVDRWPAVSFAFAETCVQHGRELSARVPENARVKGLVAEAAEHAERAEEPRHAVIAAYAVAVAADVLDLGGFDSVRAWQSRALDGLLGAV
jgi:hypothetical protein